MSNTTLCLLKTNQYGEILCADPWSSYCSSVCKHCSLFSSPSLWSSGMLSAAETGRATLTSLPLLHHHISGVSGQTRLHPFGCLAFLWKNIIFSPTCQASLNNGSRFSFLWPLPLTHPHPRPGRHNLWDFFFFFFLWLPVIWHSLTSAVNYSFIAVPCAPMRPFCTANQMVIAGADCSDKGPSDSLCQLLQELWGIKSFFFFLFGRFLLFIKVTACVFFSSSHVFERYSLIVGSKKLHGRQEDGSQVNWLNQRKKMINNIALQLIKNQLGIVYL